MLEMALSHSAIAEGGAVKRIAGSCGRRLHTSKLCKFPTVQSWAKKELAISQHHKQIGVCGCTKFA